MLRPELVAKFSKPLSPDAFTGWGKHDPDKSIHNQEVIEATQWLLNEVIPNFASQLEQLTEEEIERLRLTEELHRHGINVRHLGRVRQCVTRPSVKAKILNECMARCMNSQLNERLRQLNRELRVPVEDPYRREVLKYLNEALRYKPKWWKAMTQYISEKYTHCLTDNEMNDSQILR